MKTAVLDEPLFIKKGSDFKFELDWVNLASENIDVSTFSAKMTIRKWEDMPVMLELSTETGDVTLTGNVMVFEASAEQTDKLEVSEPRFDIDVSYDDGDSHNVTVLTGTATVTADYS